MEIAVSQKQTIDYCIGIDFGTSGARAIVIDRSTHICAETKREFTATVDWAATWRQTLFDLLAQIPVSYRRATEAIAINGTSSTVLLCGDDGEPIMAPLLYNDDRAAAEVNTLRQVFAQSGYANAPGRDTVLSATSSLVKLLWWSRQPAFAQARYFLHQADWLGCLLHGQLGISDYHNSLKLGYDVARLCYPDWMEAFSVTALLPTVVAPGTPIAAIRPELTAQFELPPTCQICAGTTDSIAAFLASGASAPGEAVTSLGSTIVLKLLSETPVENGQFGIYSHRLGDVWLVGGASNTGGAVLKQFFTPAELQHLSAQIPVEQASPFDYYPLLKPGERFPINDPTLQPRLEPRSSNPVEFLHGLLESMARIEANGYQRLQELGATPLKQVYTAGGGATNPAWTAIRSRQLGVPVMASAQTEAAYGTALLARSLL